MADLTPYTWNSLAIDDGNPFYCVIQPGQRVNLSANAVTVPRAGDFPFLSDTQLPPGVLVIKVYTAPGQTIDTARENLKKYFNVMDKTRHNFVARDSGNVQYYVTGFPVRLVHENSSSSPGGVAANSWIITLAVEFPYFQLVTATTDNWAITGTGDTQAITNAGNIAVPPIITLTPTTTKGAGLAYRRYVAIDNNLNKTWDQPLDITAGGIDTAALTTAKMQADGDDARVWEDGTFSDRWLDAMDSAATKFWKNFYMGAKQQATLLTTVNDSVQTFAFTQTKASLEFLRFLKSASNRTLRIEDETVNFDPANVNLIAFQITSLTRGSKPGFAAAAHTAPVTVRYLPHDLFILYGDSTLSAQDIDDDYKPIIDLDSTNAAWSWTNYFDADSNRSGMWQGGVSMSKTGLSYVFTDDENTFTDPSEAMGMALVNYTDNRVQFEVGILEWVFSHPGIITNVDFSGKKYNTDSWPAVAGLQYLQNNTAWFTGYNEDAPTVPETWETFGVISVDLGDGYETIRFVMDGALSPNPNEGALLQVTDVTTTFESANLPTISVGAEAVINFFDFKITNNTTGEYILVTTPCPVDMALTIDCTTKEAYLADGTKVNVRLSTDRAEWLNLSSGSNTLQFDDVGTVAITGTVSHRDRVL